MHEHEARLEKLREQRVETPKAGKALRLPGNALAGRAGPLGRARHPARGPRGGLPARPWRARPDGSDASEAVTVARSPFLAAQRGDRIGIVGPNGAGKTTLLRTIAGDLPALDGAITSATTCRPPISPSCATPRSPARPSSTRSSRRSRSRPARPAATSRGSCSAATTCSRRCGCCRAASGRASSSRCSASCRRTCCSSTSPRTTSTSPPARPSRRSSPRRRRRSWSCRTTGGCWRRSASGCGWSTTAWRCRSTAATAPGARRSPRAGPSRPRRRGARTAASRPAAGDGTPGPEPRRAAGRRAATARGAAGHGRGAAAEGAPEAVEGRVPPPPRGPRRRAVPARAPAQPARAGGRARRRWPANFVEMRRVTSELADVERALAEAEDAWLELEEQAP